MRTHVVDHPLVAHKLTALRDVNTDSPTFRRLADELVTLLAYEATRDVRVEPSDIVTPVAPTTGVKLAPRSRSWCRSCGPASGMLDGMMRLLPTAEVGFLGMVRNEETLEASTYAERLPDDLSGRQCYVLDPMLATGGTLAAAIRFLTDRGRRPHHRDLPAGRARGLRAPRAGPGRARRPGHRRHRRDGREAQREGLHRARARRRGRPALRRRGERAAATSASPALHRAGDSTRPQPDPSPLLVLPVSSESGVDRGLSSSSIMPRQRPPQSALTALSSLPSDSLASPNSSVVRGSKSSSFSMPANPGRIERFMNTTCFASSALRIGMP